MNKLAAEKIAQEYYQIGQVLAFESNGLIKEANTKSKLLKGLGITGAAGIGAMDFILDHPRTLPKLSNNLGKFQKATGLDKVGDSINKLLIKLQTDSPEELGNALLRGVTKYDWDDFGAKYYWHDDFGARYYLDELGRKYNWDELGSKYFL